jgi:FkbM family methyltransferase
MPCPQAGIDGRVEELWRVVPSSSVRLFRDVRFAAANPAATDFAQLAAWTRTHDLAGDQSVGEEFAWVKRGLPVRTAEWARQLLHGRPSPTERADRRYDILTVEAMRRVLGPGSNCIDIGAATGDILRFIQVLAPNGNHHAFEPIPFQASELRLRFPTVQVHELALSDEPGNVDFFVVKDDPWISALRDPQEIRGLVGDTRRSDWQIEAIPVITRRLDDVLDASEAIDFIKMDVEGAEVSVFRGALQTLAESSPIVIFEYSGVEVEKLYGATNLLDTLSEVGFCVSSLEGWLAGDSPLGPSEFPNRDTTNGFWNWMYVAHPLRSP